MKTYSAYFKSNGEKIFEHIPGNKLWEMLPKNSKLKTGGHPQRENEKNGVIEPAEQAFDCPQGKFVVVEDLPQVV